MKENENNEKNVSFIQKLFTCCSENSEDNDLINKEESYNSIIYRAKKELENEISLFPAGTIRDEEKNKIDFTKDGLLKYILNLQNLFYQNLYNDNNLKISKRNISNITEEIPLIRFEIIKNKSYFKKVPNIQKIIDVMTKPELRIKWDDNLIEYKTYEKLNNNSEIIKIITKKQKDLIPEKEFYDKRIRIYKDKAYYFFSSSIPDNNNSISFDYEKGKNILCIMIIKEDKDNFYFDCFNQIDLNIDFTDNLIKTILPNKTKVFFEEYFEFINSF